jgi:hypothetical protein
MKMHRVSLAVALAAAVATATAASAAVVSVSGTAGPWDPAIAGNPSYGVDDQTAPTFVAVNPGETITITYLSGLTSAFGGVPPSVDASGYVGAIFGSGASCGGPPCTGIGSSGQPLPSFSIDPTNSGPQIALNALIGDFVDASGVILDEFATGNGPFSIVAPAGAAALQLGVNDDIFTTDNGALTVVDNTGALSIDVSGSTVRAVPEPATLGLVGAGLLVLGAFRRRGTT